MLVELGRDIDEVSTHTQYKSTHTISSHSVCVCLIHDCVLQEFEVDDSEGLCESLKSLATDGNKHRAKNDRRKQRSIFREVLHYIEVSITSSCQSKLVNRSVTHQ